jgi:DNA polymerase III delta subunit
LIYLFVGEEFFRKAASREQLSKIKTDFPHYKEVYLDGEELTLGKLVEEFKTLSLFEGGKIVLIKRAEQMPETCQEWLADSLKKELLKIHLILEADRAKLSKRLYTTIKNAGEIKEFKKVDRKSLPPLVREMLSKKGIKLTKEGLYHLLQTTEGNLGRIASEIGKLALFSSDKEKEIKTEDLKELIFGGGGGNIFEFLDSLSNKDLSSLVKLSDLLKREDKTKVFFMIAGQIRSLLSVKALIKEGYTAEEIASRMGQYPWLVVKRLRQAKKFTEEELIDCLHLLQQEDVRIKRGEDIEEVLFKIVFSLTETKKG